MKRFFAIVTLLILAPVHAEEPDAKLRVVGHRGLMQAAPENTLAAFQACLSLRVGFEFDVRRTKDGKLVCLHDATLERTTSGRGQLAELTLTDLRQLDAGSWFDPAFEGERVPTIAEILKLVAKFPNSGVIAVDLKDQDGGLEQTLVELATQEKVLDRLVFIGNAIESSEIRARLKAADRHAQTARLARAPENIAEVLADQNVDWVYLRLLPSAEVVSRIHRAGKRIFLAGPLVAGHEAANWKAAAELRIDALLTDYPLELQRQLRAVPPTK